MWKFFLEIIIITSLSVLLIIYVIPLNNQNGAYDLILLSIVFIFSSYRFHIYRELFLQKNNSLNELSQNNIFSNVPNENIDLMSSLSQVDISNIISVTFLPINGTGFSIKTPNIKRLSMYITTKLGKTTFEGEELRKAFDHVIANISSDLSKTDFNLIQGKINEFVKSGGEVKIEYK